MSEGRKDDSAKLPYDLIAPEILESLAKVLKFGAAKYTTEYETEWDRLLSVSGVVSLKLTTATTDVAVVTKKSLDELILSSPNDSDKIAGIGKNAILTKLRGTPNVGRLIQLVVKETLRQSGESISQSLNSQRLNTPSLSKEVVAFAEQLSTLTLTIVTKQGNLEVSFAHDVTTDLVFWETIWKDSKEQFNISKPLNTVGARNWEAGMDWSRVFSALQRHTWAWWGGEDKDPETGFSHLEHAACCIMFLNAYEQRGIGKDDREKKP